MVPWMAMRDFNVVMNRYEVSSTNTFNDNRSKDYNMWINEEGLIDLGFNRPCFTWKRGSDMNTFRTVRLDCCLSTEEWIDTFPNFVVTIFPSSTSDHNPVMLNLKGTKKSSNTRRFLFQATWVTHKDFDPLINIVLNSNHIVSFDEKLNKTRETLCDWSKNAIGDLQKWKRRALARLEGIQRKLGHKWNGGLIKLEKKITEELDDILYLEELAWFQRS
nr:uncharacterized protein LOC109160503 [Ipomoea batatas]